MIILRDTSSCNCEKKIHSLVANSLSDTQQCAAPSDKRKSVEEGPNINPTVTVSAEQKDVVLSGAETNESQKRTVEQRNIQRLT